MEDVLLTEKIIDSFINEQVIVVPYAIRDIQSANRITKQLYLTHIGYYPKATNHLRVRKEGCSEYIFICCTNGKGWISHNKGEHVIKKDQLYIIPAFEPHKYGSDNKDPWSIFWFHFKGENIDMFASIMSKVITIDKSDKSRQEDQIIMFQEMHQNLKMGYSQENLEYISFCLMHFLASIKYPSQYREINKTYENDTIGNAILFMRDHLEKKVTLEEIANHVRYSPSRLISIFREKTSFTPIVYYNQLKMQRACFYLQFSTLKVKEIAFRLCFCDPFHFSKIFSQEIGITPTEYRKQYQDLNRNFGYSIIFKKAKP